MVEPKTSERRNFDYNDFIHLLKNIIIFCGPSLAVNLQDIAETGELNGRKFFIGMMASVIMKITEYTITNNQKTLQPDKTSDAINQ